MGDLCKGRIRVEIFVPMVQSRTHGLTHQKDGSGISLEVRFMD